jgi:molybdopterin-containing oxidoreductase family membrane subunit
MAGVLGRFSELDSTVDAIDEVKRQPRVEDIQVFTPILSHEIEEAVGGSESPVRRWTLIGGFLGATFGYWIAVWTSDYWPLVVGGKAIATWVPFTILAFEVMVLIGSLATVAGMFVNSGIPKLTATVGYDPRFSEGDFGVYVDVPADQARAVEDALRRNGATEVRRER